MGTNTIDPFVSAESRQHGRNLLRYRVLFILGAAIYPAWWLILHYASPEGYDPFPLRLAVGTLCLAGFLMTFAGTSVTRYIHAVFTADSYLMTLHYFWLVYRNRSDENYVAATFVLVFTIGSCFLKRKEVMFYSVLVAALSIALSAMPIHISRSVFLAGIATGLFVSFVAVSSRLDLITTLSESEERFRTMADTAPVMIWMSDDKGFYTFFNEVWLKFTGRAAAEASGNGWTKSIHPDDLNRYLESYFAAFRQRKKFEMEHRLKRVDGVFRWVFSQSIPLYQPNGAFVGYIGSCVDISDRKSAEAVLQGGDPKKP